MTAIIVSIFANHRVASTMVTRLMLNLRNPALHTVPLPYGTRVYTSPIETVLEPDHYLGSSYESFSTLR